MWIPCVALPSASGNSGSWPLAYVETLGAALGHADRIESIRQYCAGLLLPRDRQTIQPIAAGVEPGWVQATHQSLHHLIAKAHWPDAKVFALVHARVLPAIQQQARSKPGSPTIPTSRKRARTRSASRGRRRLRPDSGFRDGITAVGPTYVVGIQSVANLWPPSQTPLPVKPCGGRGRPSSRVRRSRYRKPVSVRELAAALPDTA